MKRALKRVLLAAASLALSMQYLASYRRSAAQWMARRSLRVVWGCWNLGRHYAPKKLLGVNDTVVLDVIPYLGHPERQCQPIPKAACESKAIPEVIPLR